MPMSEQERPLLEVSHLTVAFGRHRAVEDVSFSVCRGEVFGLVGESGCGKTTTGRAIIGLYDIAGGHIDFDGTRIAPRSRRRGRHRPDPRIQMIFQDPLSSLDPRMTVRESVSEGLIIHGERDRSAIDRRVTDVLDRVGITRVQGDRYPHEFSGGQRQRIGIARAVVMDPALIIADEPVSALDVSVQAQVINLLDDLRRDMGLTLLFIAHDLSVVRHLSDRVGVMYHGRLLESASSDELFLHPLHPYTRALLSAVPLPDPRLERRRVRLTYEPPDTDSAAHIDYAEVSPGHLVLGTPDELAAWGREAQGGLT